MRRTSTTRLAAVAAIAALLAGAPATAAAAPESAHGEKVFELLERSTASTFVDVGSDGLSVGDEFVFTDDQFRGTEKVATGQGLCVLVAVADGGSAQCQVTVSFEDGDLTIQGRIPRILAGGPPEYDVAITGGTGAFATARGTVHIHPLSATESALTYHVLC